MSRSKYDRLLGPYVPIYGSEFANFDLHPLRIITTLLLYDVRYVWNHQTTINYSADPISSRTYPSRLLTILTLLWFINHTQIKCSIKNGTQHA